MTNQTAETVRNFFSLFLIVSRYTYKYGIKYVSSLALSRDLNFIFRSHKNFSTYKKRNVTVSFNTIALRIVMISLSMSEQDKV